jgi:hypothetical protein
VGGIEYIATAMRSHPTGSELQFSACRALAKLSRHADNLVKIDAARGIGCIATSMRSHPTDGKLRLSAYLALVKLAFHADNWVKIEAAGGVECIATAIAAILPTAGYNTEHVGL